MHCNDRHGDPVLFAKPIHRAHKVAVIPRRYRNINVRIGLERGISPDAQLMILGDQQFKSGDIGSRWDTHDLEIPVGDIGSLGQYEDRKGWQ